MTNEELDNLFCLFRPGLIADLVSKGFPSSVAGALLNWFDPRDDRYLAHVNDWKELLCRGALPIADVCPALLQFGVLRSSVYNTAYPDPERDMDVQAVHQVANLFYKCRCPARKETDWDSVKQRLSTPPELSLTKGDIRRLRHALRHVDVCPPIDSVGRYGPGVTCEGYSPYDRWDRKGAIPPVPPAWYRVSVRDPWVPESIAYDFRTTKIAEVPKTLKSNRIVSSEPAQSMYAELLVNNWLDCNMHRAFTGHVYLHNQTLHNASLRSPEFCSIDLSDASDYVSCDLVSQILPNLWPLLAKVRSTHAAFPDGDVVPLATFAPMGSGMCFGVLTLVNLAIGKVACRHPTWSFYGDDGIVHRTDVIEVTDWQQAAGLRVNQGKTCYHGLFRESCGSEWFGLTDVTPIYIRESFEQTAYAKLNELCGKFHEFGWHSCVEVVKGFVTRQPHKSRVNHALQRVEVLIPVDIRADKEVNIDSWSGIRKWFIQRGQPTDERESLVAERKGRVRRVHRYRCPEDYPYLF